MKKRIPCALKLEQERRDCALASEGEVLAILGAHALALALELRRVARFKKRVKPGDRCISVLDQRAVEVATKEDEPPPVDRRSKREVWRDVLKGGQQNGDAPTGHGVK